MASRRDYVTVAEVNEMAGISTVTDLQITEAEEIIDDYVGPQEKFIDAELEGLLASGGTNNLRLDPRHQGNLQADYLVGCWIRIMGGTGKGQQAKITAQTLTGYITLETALTVATDTTSWYRIYQLGQFPRQQDVDYDGNYTNKYYKNIPEKVRRATAAQVEYMIAMGDTFFSTDKSELESERIGDYAYSKRAGNSSTTGINRLIAPKAKILLRGIKNITGSIL